MSDPDLELDDADRALLVRVRALRDHGAEPAWDQFERDLARRIDAEAERDERRWWRRLWKPVLGLALAGAAAAALLLVLRADPPPAPAPRVATPELDAAAPTPPSPDPRLEVEPEIELPLALGIAGELEDDELSDQMLDDVLAELAGEGSDDDVADWTRWGEEPEDGLVPDLDLEWVDQLEDDEVEAVARWLDDEAG